VSKDPEGVEIMDREIVTIVSGLPRSGTSLMMSMLEAGGMDVLTDHIRTPDEDNPKGYYEFERVRQIEHDQAWLVDAKGRAVKMIAELLKYLPPGYTYKVIFMRRTMKEILASQKRMLVRRGEPTEKVSDEEMAAMFQRYLNRVEAWLANQPNIEVMYVSYNRLLDDPTVQLDNVNQFLGGALDVEQMIRVIEPSLYRQRG
jgi:hypothetical protein